MSIFLNNQFTCIKQHGLKDYGAACLAIIGKPND